MTSPDRRAADAAPERTTEPEAESPPARQRPVRLDLDLEAVRRRDRDALAALFESYFDRLYSWTFRWLGDVFASEDAVQEVFLRVHRACDTLDTSRDPWPWLMAIATNVCRDVWRSSGRQVSQSAAPLEEEFGGSAMTANQDHAPDEQAERRERERLVQEAILSLPETQRSAVLLRDYAGLRHDEIAEIIGATPVAARKTYSRALAALGAELEERLG